MPTIRENEFIFNKGTNISSISFQLEDHIITDNQPWDGVTFNSTTGVFLVKAGRKGSTKCADWYKKFVNSESKHMIHTEGGSHKPDELNFAFQGILTINGFVCHICIGQGHYGTTNNWHIASKLISADSNGKNGAIGFSLNQNGSHSFDLL